MPLSKPKRFFHPTILPLLLLVLAGTTTTPGIITINPPELGGKFAEYLLPLLLFALPFILFMMIITMIFKALRGEFGGGRRRW